MGKYTFLTIYDHRNDTVFTRLSAGDGRILMKQTKRTNTNVHAQERRLHETIIDFAKERNMPQTLASLEFALQHHKGQYRSGGDHLPYICHPMTVAVQAIALGFDDDGIVAACLLHDVIEDCNVTEQELPVEEDVRLVVRLLTRDRKTGYTEAGRSKYYSAIAENPAAVIVKLLDRSSNVSDMATGFPYEKIMHYLEETHRWIYPLFEKAEEYYPEKQAQLLLLKYHMDSIENTIDRFEEPEKDGKTKETA